MKRFTYVVILILISTFTLKAQLLSPVLTEPPDVDIVVHIPVTLSWDAVQGATSYDIQISLDNTFSSLVNPTPYTITSTSFTVPEGVLDGFTVYYWRVRARNLSTIGQYSIPFSFRTAGTPSQEINSLEQVVSGLGPGTNINPIQIMILNQRLDIALFQYDQNHLFQARMQMFLFIFRVYMLEFSNFLDNQTAQNLVNNAFDIIGLFEGDSPSPLVDLIPKEYSLGQNYPNPFNPTTTIEYSIPKDGNVSLKIYDINGKEAATLIDKFQKTGSYITMWDASNFSSGVYFYRIISGSYVETKKMVLKK